MVTGRLLRQAQLIIIVAVAVSSCNVVIIIINNNNSYSYWKSSQNKQLVSTVSTSDVPL